MKIDLPEPLINLNIDDKVVLGELTITKYVYFYILALFLLPKCYSEETRSFFDPSVDTIIELILGQINQIERIQIRVRVNSSLLLYALEY
jgi:hypothetical protein